MAQWPCPLWKGLACLDAALADTGGARTLVIAGQDQSAIQAAEAGLRPFGADVFNAR